MKILTTDITKNFEPNDGSTRYDKSKFIVDILNYSLAKKVDDKIKERLINLIGKEFEKTGITESDISERLQKIEYMLGLKPESKKIEKQQFDYCSVIVQR